MQNVTESVGARLRRLRVDAGLSQSQLATQGTSASYISLIEAGKRAPTPRVLEQLAQRLGCSPRLLRDGSGAEDLAAAELETVWSELALANGHAEEARSRTLALLEQALDDGHQWRARLTHALACERLGALEDAIRHLEILRRLAVEEPGRWPVLPVAVALCRCYREAGDASYSIDVAQEGLAVATSLGLEGVDEYAELRASLVAGYYDRGDLTKASHLVSDLLRDTEQGGSHRARAAAHWNASLVAQDRGATGEALRLAERALALLSEADASRNQARLQLVCAAMLLRLDDPEPARARDVLSRLLDRLAAVGSTVDVAYARTELARAELQLGHPAAATAHAELAYDLLGPEPRIEKAQSLLVLAQALRADGRLEAAAARSRQAAQLLGLGQNSRQAALAWNDLASLLAELGQPDEALRACQQALAALGLPQPRADHVAALAEGLGPGSPTPGPAPDAA